MHTEAIMIHGILFFDSGEVQVIGTPTNLRAILRAIHTIIPQLEEQQQQNALQDISTADLIKYLELRQSEEKT